MCSCSVSFSLPLIFTVVAASISPFSHRRYKIFVFFFQRNLDCKTVRTCVFKYARAVKQKVWNEAENRERDWGETLKIRFFFLSPHTPYGTLPISLLILRKKPTVLQSKRNWSPMVFFSRSSSFSVIQKLKLSRKKESACY